MKKNTSMSAILIIGIVYTGIGAIFSLIGLGLFLFSQDPDGGIVGMVFTPMGLVFLALGIVFLVLEQRRRARNRALVEAGRYVWGEVVDCVPNLSVRINGRCPYMLLVRYTDPRGNDHLFKSGNLKIYRDPRLMGQQVRIYYENDSFRRYYVDAEPILPKVIEH